MHHPTDRIAHITVFVTPVVEHWLEREIAYYVEYNIHCLGYTDDLLFNVCIDEIYMMNSYHNSTTNRGMLVIKCNHSSYDCVEISCVPETYKIHINNIFILSYQLYKHEHKTPNTR